MQYIFLVYLCEVAITHICDSLYTYRYEKMKKSLGFKNNYEGDYNDFVFSPEVHQKYDAIVTTLARYLYMLLPNLNIRAISLLWNYKENSLKDLQHEINIGSVHYEWEDEVSKDKLSQDLSNLEEEALKLIEADKNLNKEEVEANALEENILKEEELNSLNQVDSEIKTLKRKLFFPFKH